MDKSKQQLIKGYYENQLVNSQLLTFELNMTKDTYESVDLEVTVNSIFDVMICEKLLVSLGCVITKTTHHKGNQLYQIHLHDSNQNQIIVRNKKKTLNLVSSLS